MDPSRGSTQLWTGLTGAWAALSYPISGIVLWGGVGLWLDRVLGVSPLLTVIGVLVGNAAGIYLMYLRFPVGEKVPAAAGRKGQRRAA